ncbi:MAG: UBP-type zinc finger domain-containing protein [Acidimicrobiia bacterium]
MNVPCEHLAELPDTPIPEGGCVECLAIGGTWVHLRHCPACGTTRCCDSSPNRHASKHAAADGHPVVRSAEPGETWAWCYVDEVLHDPARA